MRLIVWGAVLTMLVAGGAPAQTTAAAVDGTVKDGAGLAVAGAIITLETVAGAGLRTTATDQEGAFHFGDVAPGDYNISVAAGGFAAWTEKVTAGVLNPAPVAAMLQVAPLTSTIEVTPPPKEVAAEQLKSEEKQRVLGVFPHFLVTYEPNAAPLTAGQKFQLGFKTLVDPVTLLGTGVDAGIQHAQNRYPEFGQGVEGYAKRFGARYTSHISGVMIHHVILQAVFHQDPRYFYRDTGSFKSRVWYSIWTAFVCKGDNGHWQPDYSDVIGWRCGQPGIEAVLSIHVAPLAAAVSQRAGGFRRQGGRPSDGTVRGAQVYDPHAEIVGDVSEGAGGGDGGTAGVGRRLERGADDVHADERP